MKIEHGLNVLKSDLGSCLNPYSNGMKIELKYSYDDILNKLCLNPYSNGMKIERYPDILAYIAQSVLILILME